METNLIAVEQFCTYYNVEFSFIESLNELGLIEIIPLNDQHFLPHEQLKELEKMIRLHYDLDINMAGIDAIAHLLTRINNLQQELNSLKNSL